MFSTLRVDGQVNSMHTPFEVTTPDKQIALNTQWLNLQDESDAPWS